MITLSKGSILSLALKYPPAINVSHIFCNNSDYACSCMSAIFFVSSLNILKYFIIKFMLKSKLTKYLT